MNLIGVQAKIFEEEKCIYEHRSARSHESDLKTLLRDLRGVQLEVNHFLTMLIQQRGETSGAQKTADILTSSDVESNSSDEKEEEEETQVNPKKCKLST